MESIPIPTPTPDPAPVYGRTERDKEFNVRNGAGIQYPIMDSLESDSKVEVLERYGEWYRIRTESLTGFIPQDGLILENCTGIATDSLNVQSGAGEQYPIIGSLESDIRVEVLEMSGEWYRIRTESLTGFVRQDGLVLEQPLNRTGIVTAGILNVRSGAGESFDVTGNLPQNSEVEILETMEDWYRIRSEDLEGYVHRDDVEEVTE